MFRNITSLDDVSKAETDDITCIYSSVNDLVGVYGADMLETDYSGVAKDCFDVQSVSIEVVSNEDNWSLRQARFEGPADQG